MLVGLTLPAQTILAFCLTNLDQDFRLHVGQDFKAMAEEKFINIHELKDRTAKIVADLKKGENYVILRYSEPVGVFVNWDLYKKFMVQERDFIQKCRKCLSEIKKKKR